VHILEAKSTKDIESILKKPLAEAKNSPLDKLGKVVDDYTNKYNAILKKKYKGKNGYEAQDKALDELKNAPLDKKIKSLAKEASKYINEKNPAGQVGSYEDGLDYNIKIYGMDIPAFLNNIAESWVSSTVDFLMEDTLSFLIDDIKSEFKWVENAYQAGRGGGHLVVEIGRSIDDIEELFDEYASDLEKIDTLEELDDLWGEGEMDDVEKYIDIFEQEGKLETFIEDRRKGLIDQLSDQDFWMEEIEANGSPTEWLQAYYDDQKERAGFESKDDLIDDLERSDGDKFIKKFSKEIDAVEYH